MSSKREPPRILLRWEALSTQVQVAVVFPLLAVAFFLGNYRAFGQPLARSILYCLIEATPFTALVVVATTNERSKRGR